jgi:hypothetical protein
MRIGIQQTEVFGRPLLPVQSAESLVSLSFDHWPPVRSPNGEAINIHVLDEFLNLTSLEIHPISRVVSDWIHGANLRLVSFRTSILEGILLTSAQIEQTLTASCLQSVENFFLRSQRPDIDLEPIVEAITTHLSIRSLSLEMRLDLRWCHQFARLINLKKLTWKAKRHEFASADIGPRVSMHFGFTELETKARVAFAASFKEFVQKPGVWVTVVRDLDWEMEEQRRIYEEFPPMTIR